MIISLTDITIQRLKPTDRQVIYWDTNLPAFGLRVSPRSKAFVVKVGNKVRTLGRYPDLALKGARTLAKREMILSSTPSLKTSQSAILDFLDDARGRITPAKGVFYCFTAKKGGDCINLAAHVRGITVKEAAVLLDGKKSAEPEKKNGEDFQPLAYLDATHELVIALGFTPEVCEAVGIGFAPKGSMRGNVLIPVRLPTGHLVGYVGGQGEVTLPKEWRLP